MRGSDEVRAVRQGFGGSRRAGSGASGRAEVREAGRPDGAIGTSDQADMATRPAVGQRGSAEPVACVAIGIDPGVNTGVAVWLVKEQRFEDIRTMSAAAAMRMVAAMQREGCALTVRIEDARLRRGWFGAMDRQQAKYGAGVREGVGAVKRDCSIWQDWLDLHGIPCKAVSPQDKGAKVGAERFRALTGWQGRTSEHARDAAMLVWGTR